MQDCFNLPLRFVHWTLCNPYSSLAQASTTHYSITTLEWLSTNGPRNRLHNFSWAFEYRVQRLLPCVDCAILVLMESFCLSLSLAAALWTCTESRESEDTWKHALGFDQVEWWWALSSNLQARLFTKSVSIGHQIPSIAFGTWKLGNGQGTTDTVETALSVGFDHIGECVYATFSFVLLIASRYCSDIQERSGGRPSVQGKRSGAFRCLHHDEMVWYGRSGHPYFHPEQPEKRTSVSATTMSHLNFDCDSLACPMWTCIWSTHLGLQIRTSQLYGRKWRRWKKTALRSASC